MTTLLLSAFLFSIPTLAFSIGEETTSLLICVCTNQATISCVSKAAIAAAKSQDQEDKNFKGKRK